jgi:hypothetical protein
LALDILHTGLLSGKGGACGRVEVVTLWTGRGCEWKQKWLQHLNTNTEQQGRDVARAARASHQGRRAGRFHRRQFCMHFCDMTALQNHHQ